jgi:glycosyltransferase involved in cell wall biosynthesis
MVVSEAMATSLPVIVSDTVGARDLVKQGLNGFVVRRDDVNETAAILIGLVNNPQNLWQMGQQARSCMQENTWDNVAKRVLQIYKKNFVG